MEQIKTLKVRIKDKHAKDLLKQASTVNFVWNYINELSMRSIFERRVWLSNYDMDKNYLKGASTELNIAGRTIEAISQEYVKCRNKGKVKKAKVKLRWRKSKGSNRSLGWIPFKSQQVSVKDGRIRFQRKAYDFWDSYGLEQHTIRAGAFVEDSEGKWYLTACVKYTPEQSKGKDAIGIDLGLKTPATDSNGNKLEGKEFNKLQEKLGKAQRANKKKQVKKIHAKIRNRRNDKIHKYTTKLVEENGAIFIGNVDSSITKGLKGKVKKGTNKSMLDSGWGIIRTTLEYKCKHAGVVYEEVNEAYTTVTCSNCGSKHSKLKGKAGLRIREWTCTECGTKHDRDVNAAKNILRLGLQSLEGGT